MQNNLATRYSEPMIVQFGNWLFHIRNYLFPVFYAALFIPSAAIFPSHAQSDLIGGIIILAGIFTRSITIGLVYIIRGGKNRQIYAESLVTSGIYSICRNPMYLGNILLLLGFGIFANSLLFVLLFFPLFVLFYYAIIKAEEAFLSKKFGPEFDVYRTQVNALIPDLSRIGSAFKDQHFDLSRVIKKEYNSLLIYFTGILLLLLYQERIHWQTFLIGFAILVTLYLLVKVWKYKRK